MKTIIIPEQVHDVPNWVYWLYTHSEVSVGMGFLLVIGLVVLFQWWVMKNHSCP